MSAIQLFDLNGEQRFTGTSLGGGSPPLVAMLDIRVPGNDANAQGLVLFDGTGPAGVLPTGTIMTGPETAAATDAFWLFIRPPLLSGGTLTLSYAELLVANGAGTQKLIIGSVAPAVMVENTTNTLAFANTSVVEQIGADLALIDRGGGDGPAIRTTAGGQFFARLFASFTWSP